MGSIVVHRFDTNGWNRRTGATGVPNGRFADWQRLGSRRAWHLPPIQAPCAGQRQDVLPLALLVPSQARPPARIIPSPAGLLGKQSILGGARSRQSEILVTDAVHKIAPGVTCRVRPEQEQCRRCSPRPGAAPFPGFRAGSASCCGSSMTSPERQTRWGGRWIRTIGPPRGIALAAAQRGGMPVGHLGMTASPCAENTI